MNFATYISRTQIHVNKLNVLIWKYRVREYVSFKFKKLKWSNRIRTKKKFIYTFFWIPFLNGEFIESLKKFTMDIIYSFGDNFYRNQHRDYEKFPIEDSIKSAQGKNNGKLINYAFLIILKKCISSKFYLIYR